MTMDNGRPCRISRYHLAAKVSGERCLRCKEGPIHPPDHIVVVGISVSAKAIALVPIVVARRKQNVRIHRVKQGTPASEGVWIAKATIPVAVALDEVAGEKAKGGHRVLRIGVHVRHDGVSPTIILSSLKDTAGGTTEAGTAKVTRVVGLVGNDATVVRVAGALTGGTTHQASAFLAARSLVARTRLLVIWEITKGPKLDHHVVFVFDDVWSIDAVGYAHVAVAIIGGILIVLGRYVATGPLKAWRTRGHGRRHVRRTGRRNGRGSCRRYGRGRTAGPDRGHRTGLFGEQTHPRPTGIDVARGIAGPGEPAAIAGITGQRHAVVWLRAKLSCIGARADGAVGIGVASSFDLTGQSIVAGAGAGGETGTAGGRGTFGIAAIHIELDREFAPVGAFCGEEEAGGKESSTTDERRYVINDTNGTCTLITLSGGRRIHQIAYRDRMNGICISIHQYSPAWQSLGVPHWGQLPELWSERRYPRSWVLLSVERPRLLSSF